MRRYRLPVLIVALCYLTLPALSQKAKSLDSLRTDSLHEAAENLLLQNQRQKQIDSMVKVQLQKELLQASGNNRKTKELEAKLAQIATSDSIRKAGEMAKIEELKKNTNGFPVAPFNDTLFFVYTKIGSFKAEARAAAISERIKKLYDNPFYNADSLKIVENENSFDVLYNNEMVIFSITSVDALWLGVDARQLSNEYLSKIRKEIATEKKANSVGNWLRRIGLVAMIIFGLGLLIYFINKIFKRLLNFLIKNKEKYLNGVAIRKIKLLTPEKQLQLALKTNNVLRIIVIILAIYLSLPLLFSLFPETKTWTNTLLGWILTPAKSFLSGIVQFLPNLFTILVIYFLFRYAIKGAKYFVDEIQKGDIHLSGFHADWAQPTFNILKFLLYAFMLVIIFPYLPGSHSPAFRGVSVFLGILFSFGSSSAISNLVAGMVITYMRPFKIGDRVRIGDIVGDVMEKTMLVTRIRTIKNEDITVPNATVLSGSTINYSSNTKPDDSGLILHTTVTIGYDTPWKEMHQALINAALRTDLLLKSPMPFVLQTSLDDNYVSYQINAYTKEANKQAVIYSDLHRHIQDCCNEAGIEILSPQYRYQRDGNMTTIPANYLNKDYKPPTFKFSKEKNEDSQGETTS